MSCQFLLQWNVQDFDEFLCFACSFNVRFGCACHGMVLVLSPRVTVIRGSASIADSISGADAVSEAGSAFSKPADSIADDASYTQSIASASGMGSVADSIADSGIIQSHPGSIADSVADSAGILSSKRSGSIADSVAYSVGSVHSSKHSGSIADSIAESGSINSSKQYGSIADSFASGSIQSSKQSQIGSIIDSFADSGSIHSSKASASIADSIIESGSIHSSKQYGSIADSFASGSIQSSRRHGSIADSVAESGSTKHSGSIADSIADSGSIHSHKSFGTIVDSIADDGSSVRPGGSVADDFSVASSIQHSVAGSAIDDYHSEIASRASEIMDFGSDSFADSKQSGAMSIADDMHSVATGSYTSVADTGIRSDAGISEFARSATSEQMAEDIESGVGSSRRQSIADSVVEGSVADSIAAVSQVASQSAAGTNYNDSFDDFGGTAASSVADAIDEDDQSVQKSSIAEDAQSIDYGDDFSSVASAAQGQHVAADENSVVDGVESHVGSEISYDGADVDDLVQSDHLETGSSVSKPAGEARSDSEEVDYDDDFNVASSVNSLASDVEHSIKSFQQGSSNEASEDEEQLGVEMEVGSVASNISDAEELHTPFADGLDSLLASDPDRRRDLGEKKSPTGGGSGVCIGQAGMSGTPEHADTTQIERQAKVAVTPPLKIPRHRFKTPVPYPSGPSTPPAALHVATPDVYLSKQPQRPSMLPEDFTLGSISSSESDLSRAGDVDTWHTSDFSSRNTLSPFPTSASPPLSSSSNTPLAPAHPGLRTPEKNKLLRKRGTANARSRGPCGRYSSVVPRNVSPPGPDTASSQHCTTPEVYSADSEEGHLGSSDPVSELPHAAGSHVNVEEVLVGGPATASVSEPERAAGSPADTREDFGGNSALPSVSETQHAVICPVNAQEILVASAALPCTSEPPHVAISPADAEEGLVGTSASASASQPEGFHTDSRQGVCESPAPISQIEPHAAPIQNELPSAMQPSPDPHLLRTPASPSPAVCLVFDASTDLSPSQQPPTETQKPVVQFVACKDKSTGVLQLDSAGQEGGGNPDACFPPPPQDQAVDPQDQAVEEHHVSTLTTSSEEWMAAQHNDEQLAAYFRRASGYFRDEDSPNQTLRLSCDSADPEPGLTAGCPPAADVGGCLTDVPGQVQGALSADSDSAPPLSQPGVPRSGSPAERSDSGAPNVARAHVHQPGCVLPAAYRIVAGIPSSLRTAEPCPMSTGNAADDDAVELDGMCTSPVMTDTYGSFIDDEEAEILQTLVSRFDRLLPQRDEAAMPESNIGVAPGTQAGAEVPFRLLPQGSGMSVANVDPHPQLSDADHASDPTVTSSAASRHSVADSDTESNATTHQTDSSHSFISTSQSVEADSMGGDGFDTPDDTQMDDASFSEDSDGSHSVSSASSSAASQISAGDFQHRAAKTSRKSKRAFIKLSPEQHAAAYNMEQQVWQRALSYVHEQS